MPKISFIKSDDRRYNIERCLSLIKSEVSSGIKNAKHIVIKPNCVTENAKLAATNSDAIEALLEFISPYARNQIILAEGTGIGNTLTAFKNFDYLRLQEKYDFQIIDLNSDDYKEIELINSNNELFKARIAKTVMDADYLISITPPKTHNNVIYTGAIKNAAVGALLRPPTKNALSNFWANRIGRNKNYKMMIHQGSRATNENIARIFRNIPLQLAIIDGFEAMEGNGPIDGDMVPSHFAIASSEPLGADWLSCQMMGIDTNDVGYLALLKPNPDHYFIIGDDWKENIIQFKMHPDFESQRKWQE